MPTKNTIASLTIRLLPFLLLAAAPLMLSEFRLSLLGKYLAYAIVAVGLDLIWGYAGILSLGHGVFFGLGAYCLAMHLKLAASKGALPDFMSWSGVDKLPWFWEPFRYAPFAVAMAILMPVFLSLLLGYFTFRNRIKGTFFSILTQALVIIVVTLFVGQQGYTGGTNGLTNFDAFLGMSLRSHEAKLALYYVTLAVAAILLWVCSRLVAGRFGRVLIAIRDGENRMRFLGYNPVVFKLFVYALSAALAGLAGMLFVLQEGIVSPAQMGIVPSIEIVLWVAVGGRGTLWGGMIGALLTNAAKTSFSEAIPDWWPILLGAAFLIVVLWMPNGFLGALRGLSFFRRTAERPNAAVSPDAMPQQTGG